jgi:AcrR family transcriptional regulator
MSAPTDPSNEPRKRRPRRRPKRLLPVQVRPPDELLPGSRPGQPGGKRDVNRRDKTQALCDAALSLFLELGIEGTRIDDITKAAGVAKGSFYRYFADKTQLTQTLMSPLSDAVIGVLERAERAIDAADAPATLHAAYANLGLELGFLVVEHAPAIRLYLQERRAPDLGARAPVAALAREIEARAERLSARARERGLLRRFPPQITSLAVLGAAEQLLDAFLSGRDLGDPAQIPALVTTMVLGGLGA